MTIEQTVTIPADRRITIEVPREVPTGATARIEFNVIPFVREEEKSASTASPKFRLTKKELDEMLENCPITQELSGLLSGLGDITTVEQIREERLAKHLS